MLFGSQLLDEFLEFLFCELGSVVGHDGLGYAKSSEDVSLVETEDVMGRDVGKGFSFYPLGEVIDDNDDKFILVGSLDEWPEDVHAPPREWPQGSVALKIRQYEKRESMGYQLSCSFDF